MRSQPNVTARLRTVLPSDCAISAITSYELFTGIAKCTDPMREQSKVDLLLKTLVELSFDSAAAREAGSIRGVLESRGQMIGPYDVLLAGQAIAKGLILVTANVGEFQRVPRLVFQNWRIT